MSPRPELCKGNQGTNCERGREEGKLALGGPGQARNSPVARVPFQRHSSVLTAVPKVPKSHRPGGRFPGSGLGQEYKGTGHGCEWAF